jgi:hypothetical protein
VPRRERSGHTAFRGTAEARLHPGERATWSCARGDGRAAPSRWEPCSEGCPRRPRRYRAGWLRLLIPRGGAGRPCFPGPLGEAGAVLYGP